MAHISMAETSITEAILRRDRLVVASGLLVVCALCWGYLVTGAGTGMDVRAMTVWGLPRAGGTAGMAVARDGAYWAVMLAMWWVMMIAMMIPSAAPMVLLHARVCRYAQRRGRMKQALVPTAFFTGGYLLAWLGFSLGATALHWGLEAAGLVHAMKMWSTDAVLSAALLIAAGLYQLTPVKNACLENCRQPAAFLSRSWRDGRAGAVRMGLHHGLYCVGCCWTLMALLFVGGAMNLVWIAGLAALVLVEKLAFHGRAAVRVVGAALIAGGAVLLAS